ncbi:hypothetical protein HCA06_13965 [Listeria welshimeri]|nr:hypothetical protein [Listeria welshimeri]
MFIIFEGLDGVGKTTQIDLIKETLRKQTKKKIHVFKWSSNYMKNIYSILDKKNIWNKDLVTGLIAGDFLSKYHNLQYKSAEIVLFDRYIYTALIRDISKGFSKEVISCLYEGVKTPDLVIFFKLDSNLIYERLIKREREIKFWEYSSNKTTSIKDTQSEEKRVINYLDSLQMKYTSYFQNSSLNCYEIDCNNKSIIDINTQVQTIIDKEMGEFYGSKYNYSSVHK